MGFVTRLRHKTPTGSRKRLLRRLTRKRNTRQTLYNLRSSSILAITVLCHITLLYASKQRVSCPPRCGYCLCDTSFNSFRLTRCAMLITRVNLTHYRNHEVDRKTKDISKPKTSNLLRQNVQGNSNVAFSSPFLCRHEVPL